MPEETNFPAIPEIVRKPEDEKEYVRVGDEEYGPWDMLDERIELSPDRAHWAITGKQRNNYYVLSDGCQYGPFFPGIIGPWFDPGRGTFVFSAQRDNEFFLVAGGEIIKEGKIVEKAIGNEYLVVNRKRFGPYEHVRDPLFSLSGKKWAAAVRRDNQIYLLLNGKEHGPFLTVSQIEFSEVENVCTCHCITDQGKWLLIGSEQLFGPYESISGPYFSPNGKRWGADIEKKKWYGFMVDGIEYGPFTYQLGFMPRFSRDSQHWFVTLDSGYEDNPHSFILDGVKYGRFKLINYFFMEDNKFIALYKKGGVKYIFLDGHTIGPFRYNSKKIVHLENDVLYDLVFKRKGNKKVAPLMNLCGV